MEKFDIVAKQLGEVANVSPTIISRYRTGKRELTTRILEQLLEALPEKAYLHFLELMAQGIALLKQSEPDLHNPALEDDRDFQRQATERLIARYAAKCTPDEFDHLLGVIVDSRRLAAERARFKH